jgi:hypothetical protein
MYIKLLQRVLKHDPVHYSCQHTDVVGGRSVHVARAFGNTAKDVSAANHYSYLYAQ